MLDDIYPTDYQISLANCPRLRVVNLHVIWFGSHFDDTDEYFHQKYLTFMIAHLPAVTHLRLGLFCAPNESFRIHRGLRDFPWPDIFRSLPRDPPIAHVDLCLLWGTIDVRPLPWTDTMIAHVKRGFKEVPCMYEPLLSPLALTQFCLLDGTTVNFRLTNPADDSVAVFWE